MAKAASAAAASPLDEFNYGALIPQLEVLEEKHDDGACPGIISAADMIRAATDPSSPQSLKELIWAGGNISVKDENGRSLFELIVSTIPRPEFSENLVENLSLILSCSHLRVSPEEAEYSITQAESSGKLSMLGCLLASEAITGIVPHILQDAGASNSFCIDDNKNDHTLLEVALMHSWQGRTDKIIMWLRENQAALNPSLEKLVVAVSIFDRNHVKTILVDPKANYLFMQNAAKQFAISIETLKMLDKHELISSKRDLETNGNTLLSDVKLANISGDYNDVIELLISKGAVYEPKPQDLIIAIYWSNPRLVAELLDNFDPNVQINNQDVFSVSVCSAKSASKDQKQNAFKVVQTILEHKIFDNYSLIINSDVICQALREAVGDLKLDQGDLQLLELLLSNPRINENLNNDTINHFNILELAIKSNMNLKYIDLFKKHGAVCKPTANKFQLALKHPDSSLIVALTDASTEDSLKIPDANGYTALAHLIHAATTQEGGYAAAAAIGHDDTTHIIPKIFESLQAMIYRKGAAGGNVLMVRESDIECLFKLTDFFPHLISPCKIESFNFRDHLGSIVPHSRSPELLDKLRTNADRAHELLESIAELMPEAVNTIVMGYIGAYVANSGRANQDLATISSSRYSDDKIEVVGFKVVGDDGAAAGLV